MTQIATRKNPEFITLIENRRDEIKKALPSIISSERFMRLAITEIGGNDSLLQCTPLSLVKCVMQASQIGLEFGSHLGKIYMVSYKNKKGEHEATIQLGYKGLMDLVRRSGEIKAIESGTVYDTDEFEVERGETNFFRHRMKFPRGKPVLYYAKATLNNGAILFDVMELEEVEYLRDTYSRAADKDAWTKSFSEMAKKSILRRLCKILPLQTEVADALKVEDDLEVIEEQPRKPELVAQVRDGQFQPSEPERDAAWEELETLYTKCDALKIDNDDLPTKPKDEYTTQEIFACLGVVKERLKVRAAQDGSGSKNQ